MGRAGSEALARVMRVTAFAVVLQLAALILFLVSVKATGSAGIGSALAVLIAGAYSLPFWAGAVVIGAVIPLVLLFTGAMKRPGAALAVLASVLILVGGFLTKYLIIAAGQVGGV
jgi:formate-dependent nitrite reductase membrane component NrfD